MAVHPQPALLAMTAELPAGEQRLQAGNSVNTPLLFPALLEKAEGQQHAGTGPVQGMRLAHGPRVLSRGLQRRGEARAH